MIGPLKRKRVDPQELPQEWLDGYIDQYCAICGQPADDEHHWIHTRGARPDLKDVAINKLPVCGKHHKEAHRIGRRSFFKKYKHLLSQEQRAAFSEEVGQGE